MSDGVAGHVEPLAAAPGMHPALVMNSFWIVTVKKIICPFLVAGPGRVDRPNNMRLSATPEFGLISLATPGALDSQHIPVSLVINV